MQCCLPPQYLIQIRLTDLWKIGVLLEYLLNHRIFRQVLVRRKGEGDNLAFIQTGRNAMKDKEAVVSLFGHHASEAELRIFRQTFRHPLV